MRWRRRRRQKAEREGEERRRRYEELLTDADSALLSGNFDEAERLYAEAIRLDPHRSEDELPPPSAG